MKINHAQITNSINMMKEGKQSYNPISGNYALTWTSNCRYNAGASSHWSAIFLISSNLNPCTFLAEHPCHTKRFFKNVHKMLVQL